MPQPLAERIAELEHQMQSLKELPAQVAALDTRMASLESQVLQSRAEMKGEFLAVRGEIAGLRTGLGHKIDGKVDGLRTEIFNKIDGDGGLREEMGAIAAGLREEIQSGDARLLSEIRGLRQESRREHEKTREYMRVLFEGRISPGKRKRSRT